MTGPVAVITGAGSGLGRVIARALLNDGHRVALAGRRVEGVDRDRQRAPVGPEVPTDVTDADSVSALFARVVQEWGESTY